MSITYPLTMPTVKTSKHITLRAYSTAGMSESPFTGQQQVYSWPREWWEADVSLPPMTRAAAEEWLAFLISLRGKYGTFLLGDPGGKNPRGSWGGTPVVAGGNTAGTPFVYLTGFTPNITAIVKAGDYVCFPHDRPQRLYKALQDGSSGAGGVMTLDVFPRLREVPTSAWAATFTNATGTFRLKENQVEWDLDEMMHYGLSFTAKEAI